MFRNVKLKLEKERANLKNLEIVDVVHTHTQNIYDAHAHASVCVRVDVAEHQQRTGRQTRLANAWCGVFLALD